MPASTLSAALSTVSRYGALGDGFEIGTRHGASRAQAAEHPPFALTGEDGIADIVQRVRAWGMLPPHELVDAPFLCSPSTSKFSYREHGAASSFAGIDSLNDTTAGALARADVPQCKVIADLGRTSAGFAGSELSHSGTASTIRNGIFEPFSKGQDEWSGASIGAGAATPSTHQQQTKTVVKPQGSA